AAVVPSIIQSVQSIVTKLPDEINNLVKWVNEITNGNKQISTMVEDAVEWGTNAVSSFFETDVLTKVQTYLASITSGVIYGVKFILNILVGLIVSVYVMASKEVFAGQAKKIVYALFKPVRANVIVETVRKSNEIFGGFISGKILDSAIIGVLAYIVLVIMRMPDTILVAVIIGVTNVIPFFGPFIGAIPSFLIIVLQDPVKGLYFLIFVIILQQIDGNIIGPKILGDSTGLSSFWVVFAIMVFGGLWGFLGMLLGVPIMAVIYYIVQRCVSYFLKKRGLSDETSEYVSLTRVDKKTNQMVYEEPPAKKKKKQEPEQKESDS
ncbi:MAG: AI-2E family transporter, partial [Roseburia sp.]|nr:AI-2E family transporter [Roseburia sp.]